MRGGLAGFAGGLVRCVALRLGGPARFRLARHVGFELPGAIAQVGDVLAQRGVAVLRLRGGLAGFAGGLVRCVALRLGGPARLRLARHVGFELPGALLQRLDQPLCLDFALTRLGFATPALLALPGRICRCRRDTLLRLRGGPLGLFQFGLRVAARSLLTTCQSLRASQCCAQRLDFLPSRSVPLTRLFIAARCQLLLLGRTA